MSYHIHHSPKPITPFSLYTTEKPERFKTAAEGVKVNDEFMEKVIKEWRKHSHLAYLQEPKFKVGENIWYYGKQYEILENQDNTLLLLQFEGYTKLVAISGCSHFYPGQKIDPSKVSYVREVEKWNKIRGIEVDDIEITLEWQPAPEPSEDDYQSAAGVKMEVSYEHLKKEHDKWLTDLSEGKIRAIIN